LTVSASRSNAISGPRKRQLFARWESDGSENSHCDDQLIYVIEESATGRVSCKECAIKAGDFVTIPAVAPHTLRTGTEKLFALTVFAPPDR
jgi:mannose-6-phosphate isomerase-like protein (cupin superfamily)